MWRPRPSTSLTSGIALIAVAIAAITLSRSFDGFVQGLLGGAGVMLALIGTFALSPLLSRTSRRSARPHDRDEPTGNDSGPDGPADDDEADRGWLPSRDSRS